MKSFFTLLVFFYSIAGMAQIATWDGGGGSTDWHNPLNWNPNAVPCNTCTAIVNNALVNISATDTIKELRVENGSFFFIGVNATLRVQNGANAVEVNDSQFTNNGILRITGFSNLSMKVFNNA